MDVPDSVPGLAELIDDNAKWGNQCCWNNQKKGRQNAARCRNTIRGRDLQERDGLISSLRILIRSATQTAILGPATPESVPEIHDHFEKVSVWLLCKGKHRSESKKIVRKWRDELDNLEDTKAQLATIDIREELNIDEGEALSCHGRRKKDGKRCTQPISAKNRDRVKTIVASLAEIRDISPTTKEDVVVLAGLLMCQRYHQDQAIEKSDEWFKKIQKLLAPADASPEQPSAPQQSSTPEQSSTPKQSSTPPYGRTNMVDSGRSESTASSIFSKAGSTAASTPSTSPPSRGRSSTNANASESPLPPRRATSTTITDNVQPQPGDLTRVTRNSTFALKTDPAVPKFKPFPPKDIKAVIARIHERIKRPIIPREEDTGHIYGFQRDGDSLIKFGYTCKMVLESRIRRWNTQCKQKVRVVLQEYLPHAAKVESIVQAILYRERRREILVGRACNGGKGCSTVHEEWFDVTLERLLDVVEQCKRWIRTWPYENGRLKPIWVEHINKLYKTQSIPLLEDWRAWIDITTLTEGTIIQETISSNVEEKTGIIITTTEIKTEPDGNVTANIQDLRQDLSDISRGYNESIIEIKAEATEEKPLTEYPAIKQDLSLHIDDPFVTASVVTTVPA